MMFFDNDRVFMLNAETAETQECIRLLEDTWLYHGDKIDEYRQRFIATGDPSAALLPDYRTRPYWLAYTTRMTQEVELYDCEEIFVTLTDKKVELVVLIDDIHFFNFTFKPEALGPDFKPSPLSFSGLVYDRARFCTIGQKKLNG